MEKYRKRGSKYKQAPAWLILSELEELCAALAEGTPREKEVSEDFSGLIRLLRAYYNYQGWV